MPLMRSFLSLLGVLVIFASGCAQQDAWPSRPILLICPWAVGGGTDRVSRQIAAFLEQELGVPMNVVNATGGAGVTGHSRGARARPDGYTLTMMTVEINMLRWRKLTSTSWEDFTPVMLLNRDAAAIFVRVDSEWETLAELTDAVRQRPGELTASGTATGGIWHLGLAGWLQTAGLQATDVTWVPSNGAAPSMQDLASGGLDMVCCSLPEARALLGSKTVRCLGLMAAERVEAYPDVATFKQQGIDWKMGVWRGLGFPRGTAPEMVDRLEQALRRIMTGETKLGGKSYPESMAAEGFDASWEPPDEFRETLRRTDEELGKLLTSEAFAALLVDKFRSYDFPMLLGVVLLVLLGMLWLGRDKEQPQNVDQKVWIAREGLVHVVEVVLAVVFFVSMVERLGFLLTAGALLGYLLWRLGTRPAVSGLLTIVIAATTYHIFAHLLRVPLPRGYLGW